MGQMEEMWEKNCLNGWESFKNAKEFDYYFQKLLDLLKNCLDNTYDGNACFFSDKGDWKL